MFIYATRPIIIAVRKIFLCCSIRISNINSFLIRTIGIMKRGLRILLIGLATMTVLVGAGVGAIYAGWIGNPLSYQTQLEITGRLACGNRFVDAKLDEAYEKYVTFNCNLTEAEPSAKAIEQILADLTRLTPLVMKGHGREKGYEILAINFGRGRDVYGNPSREVAVRVFMGAEITKRLTGNI